jgi:hypothetical protein
MAEAVKTLTHLRGACVWCAGDDAARQDGAQYGVDIGEEEWTEINRHVPAGQDDICV